MKKITVLSNFMIGAFTIHLVWLLISFIAAWYYLGFPPTQPTTFGFAFSTGPLPNSLSLINYPVANANPEEVVKFLSHVPIVYKSIAAVIGLTNLIASMWLTGLIITLFKRYRKKRIFDSSSAVLIQKICLYFFITQLLYTVGAVVNTYIYSLRTQPIISLSLGTKEVTVLILGLMGLAMSWIIAEAQKMREEQLLTI